MSIASTARISPTAHYTGYVWAQHDLSAPGLATWQGALLHAALRPFERLANTGVGGNTLDRVLLHRHAVIDTRLRHAVEQGGVRRVLEIAGGLSARGVRFAREYPELRYVEGDLSAMAARKRARLRGVAPPSNHAVVALDALASDGAGSITSVLERELPGEGPVAVITEGLLNYFDRLTVECLWRRLAASLEHTGGGVYLGDLHVRDETLRYPMSRVFVGALGVFARGDVHIHYGDAGVAGDALVAAGFDTVQLYQPRTDGFVSEPGADIVRIIEATVTR